LSLLRSAWSFTLLLLSGSLLRCLLLPTLALRLLGLLTLLLLLLLRGATSCLFSLSLIALFLIFLASFLSAAAATLRAADVGNADGYRQRKDSRGCEALIINFH
jgi:hypothetical protein